MTLQRVEVFAALSFAVESGEADLLLAYPSVSVSASARRPWS